MCGGAAVRALRQSWSRAVAGPRTHKGAGGGEAGKPRRPFLTGLESRRSRGSQTMGRVELHAARCVRGLTVRSRRHRHRRRRKLRRYVGADRHFPRGPGAGHWPARGPAIRRCVVTGVPVFDTAHEAVRTWKYRDRIMIMRITSIAICSNKVECLSFCSQKAKWVGDRCIVTVIRGNRARRFENRCPPPVGPRKARG